MDRWTVGRVETQLSEIAEPPPQGRFIAGPLLCFDSFGGNIFSLWGWSKSSTYPENSAGLDPGR